MPSCCNATNCSRNSPTSVKSAFWFPGGPLPKRGKPSCHCAKKDDQGHGPSDPLTRPVAGKTVTRIIPAGPAVQRTRQQLHEYHRFRQLIQQLVAVSEDICDWQLRHAGSPAEDNKKNLARRPARR